MNDTTDLLRQDSPESLLAAAWHAFLMRSSFPLWDRGVPAPSPLRVRPGEPEGRPAAFHPCGEAIRAVLSRYATVLECPMSLRIAINRYSPPDGPDAVHVHAFSLPTPPVLFGAWPRVPLVDLPLAHGIPLRPGAHRALAPGTQLGRGHLVVDADGEPVAEYLGTNLYCLFDLLGQEESWIPVLLRRHLDLGLPHLVPPLVARRRIPAERVTSRLHRLRDETEELAQACRCSIRQASREAYVRACQERLGEEIRFLQAEIAFLEDGVEEMGRRTTADTRRLKEGYRRVRARQGRTGPPDSSGELEALQSIPGVCQAGVQDGRITLTTGTIVVEHEARRYRLGRFQVELHFTGEVRITNLTNPMGPYDHPHIHRGRPCLGSIREGVAKLLGEFQFVAAAEVLMDFLHMVNPADWRLPVLHWPEAGGETDRGVPATA